MQPAVYPTYVGYPPPPQGYPPAYPPPVYPGYVYPAVQPVYYPVAHTPRQSEKQKGSRHTKSKKRVRIDDQPSKKVITPYGTGHPAARFSYIHEAPPSIFDPEANQVLQRYEVIYIFINCFILVNKHKIVPLIKQPL